MFPLGLGGHLLSESIDLGLVSGPYLGTVLVPGLGVVSALVRDLFRA